MAGGLLTVIEACYAASLDGAKWPDTLTMLAEYLGGVDATLEIHSELEAGPTFFVGGNRLPKEGIKAYLAHYSNVCPRIGYIRAQPVGGIGFDHDFASEADMDRDEFYADFLAPDDLRYFLSANLMQRPGLATGFTAIQRSPRQGHATRRDARRLATLRPHLSQALDTHLRLGARARQQASLLESLDHLDTGVVLLDAAGGVAYANAAAEKIARDADGLGISKGGIAIENAAARKYFREILAGFLADTLDAPLRPAGEVFVPRPSGLPPYALLIRRLSAPGAAIGESATEPAAIVFLHDPAYGAAPEAAGLADAFGLTRREAELAIALHAGQSLRAHAADRNIKISTARFHLYRAMAKMGARSQADMVRLLDRHIPPFNRGATRPD